MKQRFLSFFFIACACLMWAMPAWAVVNWADLGVTSLEVGQDYYIYNINQGKFLIEKVWAEQKKQFLSNKKHHNMMVDTT